MEERIIRSNIRQVYAGKCCSLSEVKCLTPLVDFFSKIRHHVSSKMHPFEIWTMGYVDGYKLDEVCKKNGMYCTCIPYRLPAKSYRIKIYKGDKGDK